MKTLVFTALLLSLSLPATTFGQEPPDLDKLKMRYEKAVEAQSDALIKRFEIVLPPLEKRAAKSAKHKKLFNAITAEKERFSKFGYIPWSEPMRGYSLEYLKDLNAVQAALTAAYEQKIEWHLLRSEVETANALREELKQVVKPQVVAKWAHGPTHVLILLSDGQRGDRSGAWEFAPGGFTTTMPGWLTKYVLSPDGLTYASESNRDGTHSGTLIEPTEND